MTKPISRSRELVFLVTSPITATTFLRGYMNALREDGWRVTLVCSPGAGLEDLALAENVALKQLPMNRNPSPLHDLISLARLIGILKRVRPDVLVYATPKASLLGAVAGAVVGVRTRIYELWGLRLETSTGVARTILGCLERLTARLSTSIVANSPSLASRAELLGVTGGHKAVVLGAGSSHGVDSSRFRIDASMPSVDSGTQQFLAQSDGFTVGFIGRVHADKGVDTLLEALDLCEAQGLEIRSVIVGGDDGAGAGLLNGVDERRVHVVGHVPDTRPYLKAMDIIVLMSRREGFPNVILEAAAMRVPAVVADSTGTRDSVVHGVTGVVVPTGDVTALTAALTALAQDPELRAQLGTNARARVEADFDQAEVWASHSAHFRAELETTSDGTAMRSRGR